jgi:hypothetical protein
VWQYFLRQFVYAQDGDAGTEPTQVEETPIAVEEQLLPLRKSKLPPPKMPTMMAEDVEEPLVSRCMKEVFH